MILLEFMKKINDPVRKPENFNVSVRISVYIMWEFQ